MPLFLCTFVLLNPYWLSAVRNSPLTALSCLWRPDLFLSTDTHLTLLTCLAVTVSVAALPRRLSLCAKTVVYVPLVASFVVRKFLLHEFGLDFTPAVLSLVMETNGPESAGFIETFLACTTGLKYLARCRWRSRAASLWRRKWVAK